MRATRTTLPCLAIVAIAAIFAFIAFAALGCGGGQRTADTPSNLDAETRAKCAAAQSAHAVSLVGADPETRARLDAVVANGMVPTVQLQPNGCNLHIEVLRCSRPMVYRSSANERVPRSDDEDLPRSKVETSGMTGTGRLLAAMKPAESLRVTTFVAGHRTASFYDDLLRTPELARRLGPDPRAFEGMVGPPLDASELVGPDCARATHWVAALRDGSYSVSVRRPDRSTTRLVDASACQPPTCTEPIGMDVRPLARGGCPAGTATTPSGCAWARRPLRWPSARATTMGCPPPAPGTPSEEAARAKRMFDASSWAEAARAFELVAAGDTDDGPATRQLAEYSFGLAAFHAGDTAGSNAAMEAIAANTCHLEHRRALYWLTEALRRRDR